MNLSYISLSDILHYPLLEELKLYNNSYRFWDVLFLQELNFVL
jgi:hypothetical protein